MNFEKSQLFTEQVLKRIETQKRWYFSYNYLYVKDRSNKIYVCEYFFHFQKEFLYFCYNLGIYLYCVIDI